MGVIPWKQGGLQANERVFDKQAMPRQPRTAYVGFQERGPAFTFPDLPGFVPSQGRDYYAILGDLAAYLAQLEAAGTPVPPPTAIKDLMKDPANRRPNTVFRLEDLARKRRLQEELQRQEVGSNQGDTGRREPTKRSKNARSGRRLAVHRPKQKIRGKRRQVQALGDWAASYQGFFPTPTPNGYGHGSG